MFFSFSTNFILFFFLFWEAKKDELEGEKIHNVYERNKNEMKLIRAWINVKFLMYFYKCTLSSHISCQIYHFFKLRVFEQNPIEKEMNCYLNMSGGWKLKTLNS